MEASLTIITDERLKSTKSTPEQSYAWQLEVAQRMSKLKWQCHCDTHPEKHPNGCCICVI